MTSDVDIVYIKLVALNEIYKCIVDKLFEAQIFILNYYILIFDFFNNLGRRNDLDQSCTRWKFFMSDYLEVM